MSEKVAKDLKLYERLVAIGVELEAARKSMGMDCYERTPAAATEVSTAVLDDCSQMAVARSKLAGVNLLYPVTFCNVPLEKFSHTQLQQIIHKHVAERDRDLFGVA